MRLSLVVAILASIAPTKALARCVGGQTVSWYGESQRLSDGSRYNPKGMTCAHRTAPRGSTLVIVDLDTGRRVECLVNDRGPAAWTGCQADLSEAAARALGILHRGVARASIRIVSAAGKATR